MDGEETFLFTSESATEGQSDKICDQISEAILDACLKEDPNSKVDCRAMTKSNMVMVFGEISSRSKVNYETVIRDVLKKIGYDNAVKGMDYRTVNIAVAIDDQTTEATVPTERKDDEGIDVGQAVGYATDETEECLPLSQVLATKLAKRLTEVRQTGITKWALPDGQTQVTVEYKKDQGALIPVRVHSVMVAAQRIEDAVAAATEADLMEHVIRHSIDAKYLDEKTIYHFSSKRCILKGPRVSGQSGHSIVQDTYGGWEPFSDCVVGKDATKRCGVYAARWVAKSLVVAKLCRRVCVRINYPTGARPIVYLNTFGTGTKPDAELIQIIDSHFDLRPSALIKQLQLTRPMFAETGCYGHFGRHPKKGSEGFTWETPKALTTPTSPSLSSILAKPS